MGNILITEAGWTRTQMWQGCILASIAHAIMVAHYPELSHEHSWDGINYNFQDSSGGRGTVTFSENHCVGAFNSHASNRSQVGMEGYFEESPQKIQEIARSETLQYLLEDVDEVPTPIVTASFWGVDEQLFSIDDYRTMIDHGGFLLLRQVLDYESAVDSWKEYYDMNSEQIRLLDSIYKRKINDPNSPIMLTSAEVLAIGTDDPEGINESKESFGEIGIICG